MLSDKPAISFWLGNSCCFEWNGLTLMARNKSGRQNYHQEPVNYSDTVKGFDKMPRDVTLCANYKKLSYPGKALLHDAATLFTGQNNGNICLAYSLMEPLGWKKDALHRARHELLYYGFLIMTKRGINRNPDLYALAWINIHHCNGKHNEYRTKEPAATYLEEKPKYTPRKKQKQPTIHPETVRVMTTGEIPTRYHPNAAH